MNIKKPFIALKNKIVSYTEEHPMEVGYYIGVGAMFVGSLIAIKIGQEIDDKRYNQLWDEAEDRALEGYGDQDYIVLRNRNGDFGAFIFDENTEE